MYIQYKRIAWWATAHGDLKESDMTKQLSTHSMCVLSCLGFPGGLNGKESACNTGDLGSISGSGRSPGEGNGNPLHSSILAWRILWTEEPERL